MKRRPKTQQQPKLPGDDFNEDHGTTFHQAPLSIFDERRSPYNLSSNHTLSICDRNCSTRESLSTLQKLRNFFRSMLNIPNTSVHLKPIMSALLSKRTFDHLLQSILKYTRCSVTSSVHGRTAKRCQLCHSMGDDSHDQKQRHGYTPHER